MKRLSHSLAAWLHLLLCAPVVVACSATAPSATPAASSTSSTASTVATTAARAVSVAKDACTAGELLHTLDPAAFAAHPTLQTAETVCETLAP